MLGAGTGATTELTKTKGKLDAETCPPVGPDVAAELTTAGAATGAADVGAAAAEVETGAGMPDDAACPTTAPGAGTTDDAETAETTTGAAAGAVVAGTGTETTGCETGGEEASAGTATLYLAMVTRYLACAAFSC